MAYIDTSLRELILKRDSNACVQCGRKDHLELHHLVRKRAGGVDVPSNLITLCITCHNNAHSDPNGKHRNTRIELGQLAHRVLLIEAAMHGVKAKTFLEELIFDNVKSDQARSAMFADRPKMIKKIETSQDAPLPTSDERFELDDREDTQKRPFTKPRPLIDKTPELVERVKILWASGVRTRREIGDAIGYPHSSTGEALKRMKASGVLKE
jgi:hypothetical protein